MKQQHQAGMTLIEMIVAMVLMGIAMISFTSFLVPQLAGAGDSHYQVRASALGQSFMSQILARGFDQNSDFDGGAIRCSETTAGITADNCTSISDFGPDTGEGSPALFNDVDDYLGCWSTPDTAARCQLVNRGNISDILGQNITTEYRNFRIEVRVCYSEFGRACNTGAISSFKRVELEIFSGTQQPMSVVAYRGNY